TVPDVVYALQGNGIDRAETAGCNGRGWNDRAMYTLNTIDRPALAYAADCRNGALSKDVSGTLQAKPNGGQSLNCVNPVVYDARGNGDGTVAPTLTGDHQRTISDYTALCVGNGQLNQISMKKQRNALDWLHDGQAVLTPGKPPRKYIVRRLLPIECCRLQGNPDGWTENLGTENPTDEEIAYWTDVFLAWQKAQGKTAKPRSRNSLVRWLSNPRTDAAEYKAFGNSVCVNCVYFVLAGIAWASGGEDRA
ncbi:MAG: hypothetical protein RR739_11315, partial [Clostridia bacterium]